MIKISALVAAAALAVLHMPAAAQTGIFDEGIAKFEIADGLTVDPRGRIQYDVGVVDGPSGLDPVLDGWGDEVRRARLGVQVNHDSGVGFKAELEFANTINDEEAVEFTDLILTYEPSDMLELTLGQHNNFQSLEELTSSLFTTFLERAAFTDAFGFERKLGASATVDTGDLLLQGGVFTDQIIDLNDAPGTPLGGDLRAVFNPERGGTRLHLGGSFHYYEPRVDAGQPTRYRQRPQFHATDTRFVATSSLPIESETSYGLEAAFIRGPLHGAGEAYWLETGTTSGPQPGFFGGYMEVGYFLTGESRGYSSGSGKFDRTKPDAPLGGGGFGAVQINARYDRLDLTDGAVVGGTQDAVLASLVWIPTARTSVTLNYGRLYYEDAAIALADGDRDYRADMFGARVGFDF